MGTLKWQVSQQAAWPPPYGLAYGVFRTRAFSLTAGHGPHFEAHGEMGTVEIRSPVVGLAQALHRRGLTQQPYGHANLLLQLLVARNPWLVLKAWGHVDLAGANIEPLLKLAAARCLTCHSASTLQHYAATVGAYSAQNHAKLLGGLAGSPQVLEANCTGAPLALQAGSGN